MSEPTRREFLATAGGALAASASRRPASRSRPSPGTDASRRRRFPRTGRMSVEGIHAYTDRVSVAAGDVDPLSRQQLVSLRAPGLPARASTSTALDRDEILHSFGPSPAAVQPIHPGSYLHRREAARSAGRAPGA